MSTAATPAAAPTAAATAITAYREQLRQELANLKGKVAAPRGQAVRLKGKVFTFPDGKTSRDPINVVVLDWVTERLYYDSPFNASKPSPPVCSAVSPDLALLAPKDNVLKKQNPTCSGCTRNEWDSAPVGRGKACSERRRIAIVPPDATIDSDPWLISVSPTGLNAFDNYVIGLEAEESIPLQVVTFIGFNPDVDYPQLKFRAGTTLTDEQLGVMFALRSKAQGILNRDPSGE